MSYGHIVRRENLQDVFIRPKLRSVKIRLDTSTLRHLLTLDTGLNLLTNP